MIIYQKYLKTKSFDITDHHHRKLSYDNRKLSKINMIQHHLCTRKSLYKNNERSIDNFFKCISMDNDIKTFSFKLCYLKYVC